VTDAGTGTRAAMERLQATKPLHIQWGMHYAVKIALRKLTVHSREVWDALIADGIITGEGRAHWLGAVFRELRDGGVLTKTGNRYKYSDEERNIHEREVALWEINPKADLTPYRLEPKEKPNGQGR
jgi:hypothetical protein